jgi:hypothetical protein
LLNIEQIGKFNDLSFDPLNRITNIITQCFQSSSYVYMPGSNDEK